MEFKYTQVDISKFTKEKQDAIASMIGLAYRSKNIAIQSSLVHALNKNKVNLVIQVKDKVESYVEDALKNYSKLIIKADLDEILIRRCNYHNVQMFGILDPNLAKKIKSLLIDDAN